MLQPHIRLDETLKAAYALLPGDPARLDRIAPFLQEVKQEAYNREFRSLTGYYKGIKILALSTGIGGTSAAIALEELKNIGVQAVIRIGSAGALQENIALGELLLAEGAVRDEGTSKVYAPDIYPAVPDFTLLRCLKDAAQRAQIPHCMGLIRSHESFYRDDNEQITRYWSQKGILGEDMESGAIMTLGRLRGIAAATVLNNVVLWGKDTAEGIGSYVEGDDPCAIGERNEILVALEALYSYDRIK